MEMSILVLIGIFFLLLEILNLLYKKPTMLQQIALGITRLILAFILIMCIVEDHDKVKEFDFCMEANDFKYECLMHLDSLREYQTQMIDRFSTHCSTIHDCDLPVFDDDLIDLIHEQEEIIDSLYDSQL